MIPKFKITLFALPLVGLTLLALCWDSYSEPVYRGKTVSQWFERLDDGMATYKDENRENEAMAALGALGQEAVPYLMKQFSTHNSCTAAK